MRNGWVIAAVLACGTARAAEVPNWSADTFRRNDVLDGHDGWKSGFAQDQWFGTDDGDIALPATDLNNTDTRGTVYGSGWAADNWLIRANQAKVRQGRTTVHVFSEDNDTSGIAFNHDDNDSFYLVGWSADDAPPPIDAVNAGTLFLLRVENGQATELIRGAATPSAQDYTELTATVQDGVISVDFGGQRAFDVTDPSPLAAGYSGFYAYDAGYDGNYGSTNVYFTDIEVAWSDDDDDSVVDDDDNCEKAANPDQADVDNDGVGNVCDPDFEPVDTGDADTDADSDADTDADTDADSDADADADTDGTPGGGDEDFGAAKCGCAAGGTGSGPFGLLIAMIAWRRSGRRRAIDR
jgi:hypothetical protein